MKILEIEKLQQKIAQFANERDWKQFHTPKNLTMALSIECSELLEIFQWLTPEESHNIHNTDKKEDVEDEMADIMVYFLRLADLLDIDIEKAIANKMKKNAFKYPVEKSKGNCLKYDKL